MKKYILAGLSVLCLPCLAFADGGVPLWGLTVSSTLGVTGWVGFGDLDWCLRNRMLASCFALSLGFLLATLIFLIIVVALETGIIKYILKGIKWKRACWVTLKANIISTLVGAVLLFIPAPWVDLHRLETGLLGPWGFGGLYTWLLYHLVCFYLSYVIEYKVAQKNLLADYELPKIKKAFLWANITTYIFMPSLLVGYVATIFVEK